MSFSHREFSNLLLAQKFTFIRKVEFWYNMDIYHTNFNPINKTLEPQAVEILRYHYRVGNKVCTITS